MAHEAPVRRGHILHRRGREDSTQRIAEQVESQPVCCCGCCEASGSEDTCGSYHHAMPSCGCGCGQDHAHSHQPGESRRQIAFLLAAGAAAAAARLLPVPAVASTALYLAAYLLAGWNVLWQAVRGLLRGQWLNETFLMAVASLGAFCIGDCAEGVAVMVFYQVGELFQGYAVDRSRRSIESLMDIRPDTANRFDGTAFSACPAEQVQPGDLILVRPGEKVPLDGTVEEGASQLDTSALTGESLPREIAAGQSVLAGCVNLSGALQIRVSKSFSESTVSRILDMVEHASASKAPQEQFITKFARYYTPAVVSIAALIAILPPLLFQGAWSDYIHRALVFLVISCPCALVISVPMGFFAGLGCASRHGILVKGGNYLDALCNVDTVVLDKTGTLTRGTFRVLEVHPVGCTEEELLALAARAESCSTHPIAVSLMEASGVTAGAVAADQITEIAGQGISAQVDGKTVLVGNHRLMDSAGLSYASADGIGTVVYVASDGVCLGHILIGDTLRPESRETLQALRNLGVRQTVMLTGDHQQAALTVGREVGVDVVHADLLPDDKVLQVETLLARQRSGKRLLFVGDGINDAPVLARADIGVAMGGLGADAAIEAADIVLMDDSLSHLPTAFQIARRTHSIVTQNIVLALGIKVAVLILGAFGMANMWAAVFADVGVSLLAILNSLRALRLKQ